MAEFHVSIFYAFREINHQIALKSGEVGSGRFIVLQDSAGPKIVIKIYLHLFYIFLFIKMYRRGDQYMTINRNFAREK